MSGDPMLDGITRYWPDIEGRGVLRPVMRPIPEDFHPDDEYVLFSDLPALLAKVRDDAVRDYAEAHYANKMQRGEERYEQGQRDEREACIAAVSAPTLHDDACCSNGCTLMHSSQWEATRRIQIALGFPLSEEPPPPYRCDGSCNCTAAAFIAAIDALRGES